MASQQNWSKTAKANFGHADTVNGRRSQENEKHVMKATKLGVISKDEKTMIFTILINFICNFIFFLLCPYFFFFFN